jgi:nucleoside-triphosphatase THEP1
LFSKTKLERRSQALLASIGSPESLLASFLSTDRTSGRLILLSGPSGCGKTTWCLSLCNLANQRGLRLGGLLSPANFSWKEKTSIDLLDVVSGERRRLAFQRLPSQRDAEDESEAVYTGMWQFDPATLAWGNEISRRLDPMDLFLLDEIGPLEFLQGSGLVSAIHRLDDRMDRCTLAVVRPGLLEHASRRWPWAEKYDLADDSRQANWRAQ